MVCCQYELSFSKILFLLISNVKYYLIIHALPSAVQLLYVKVADVDQPDLVNK